GLPAGIVEGTQGSGENARIAGASGFVDGLLGEGGGPGASLLDQGVVAVPGQGPEDERPQSRIVGPDARQGFLEQRLAVRVGDARAGAEVVDGEGGSRQ